MRLALFTLILSCKAQAKLRLNEPSSFTIAVLDAPAALRPGDASSVRIGIERVQGADGRIGMVFITGKALATGITVTGTIAADASDGIASITTAANLADGVYPLTIVGTFGAIVAETMLDLSVSAAAQQNGPVFTYPVNPAVYELNHAIAENAPTVTAGVASGFAIQPLLPDGLAFDEPTGAITGTPTALSPSKTYLVSARYVTGSGMGYGTAVPLVVTVVEQACVGTCAAAPSGGWNGPVIVTTSTTTPDSCSGHYSTQEATAHAGPQYTLPACQPCNCQVSCMLEWDMYSDSLCNTRINSAIGQSGNPCSTNSFFSGGVQSVKFLSKSYFQCGSTTAVSGPVEPYAWSTNVRLCSGTGVTAAGQCSLGEACLASGPSGGTLCVYKASAAPTGEVCPAEYADKRTYFTDASDDRTCTGCYAFGCASPGACNTDFQYSPSNTTCTTPTSAPTGTCFDPSAWQSWQTPTTYGVGCTPIGTAAATGAVAGSGALVVCCQ